MIVLAIRERHARFLADERGRREVTASISQIRDLLPAAAAFGPSDRLRGGRFVLDEQGETVGYVAQTLPAAKDVIGYSGPNDVLLAFGTDGRLTGLTLLSSGDTPDHAEIVEEDTSFWRSYVGKTWPEIAAVEEIDGVAGATLTSAAIAEGIVRRLAGSQPSFRFPEAVTTADAATFFPEAESIELGPNGAWLVKDEAGSTLGRLLRTSPGSDDRIGYGGPTDGLLALDAAGTTVVGIEIKRSYDTPRYVEDVTLDWTFLHRFDGMPLAEFAALTVGFGEDVEGVSGATMTSQTLVENLVEAAKRFREESGDRSQESGGLAATVGSAPWDQIRFTVRDIGTAVVVLLAGVIAFTNLRGKVWLRRAWQVLLIGYLGFINADLLSQALFVGWARDGVPWRLAPGLVLLAVAAFAVPLTTKTQLYCHHLCPHGAAQELLRNRLPWRVRLPRRLERVLSFVPATLLLLVAAVALGHLPVDLAGIEPFHAYAVKVAGWATLTVAAVGLVASLFVPMVYCRYGCPTGALLGHLRRNARSGRLTPRDALAAAATLISVCVAWMS